MIDTILKQAIGTRLDETQEAWLRKKLAKLTRYAKLAKHIDYFEVGCYNKYKMILAFKYGKAKGIPIPKKQLASNQSAKTRALGRLRKAVDYQIDPIRKPGYHVDHVYPFSKLAEDWLKLTGKTWSKVKSSDYPSFAEYHFENARLQYLTPAENLAKGNKDDND